MKKVLLTLLIAILFAITTPSLTHAAHLSFKPKLYLAQAVAINFSWKNTINTRFLLLKNVKNVSYMLTYNTNGVPEGVMGNFDPNGRNQVSKNIFLGTCSANSCVKHKNIKDIKMEVVFTYKDNRTETKTYNISSQ